MDLGSECPNFPIDWESMWTKGFIPFVEECRFKRDAIKYPFFKITLPTEFVKVFDLKKRTLPTDIEVATTAVKVGSKQGGVYYMNAREYTGQQKSLRRHLDSMTAITIPDWKIYFDRQRLRSLKQFNYMENMDFSLMQEIYSDPAVSLPPGWNFNDLPELKNILGTEIPGVTTCMAYAGDEYTYAPKHIEDLSLGSANIVFADSAPKLWLGFAQQYYGDVKAAVNRNFSTTCKDILLHKCLMFDIDFYTENHLPYYFAIQGPGQVIVTNPNGFHGVANTGKNYSEAVNFYCMGTVHESLKFPLCECPTVVAQYQKKEWQPYINYCQTVERNMKYSAIGVTGTESESTVNVYRKRKAKSIEVVVSEEEAAENSTEQTTAETVSSADTSVPIADDDADDSDGLNTSFDFHANPENTTTDISDDFVATALSGNNLPSDDAVVETVAYTEPQQDFVQDSTDPMVQSISQLLLPHVQFTSQPVPPPTFQPTPQPSQRTKQAAIEQGSRFRAMKSMLNPPSTPPISQATVNEGLKKKRNHLASRKREYAQKAESRSRATKKHEKKRAGTRSQRNRGVIAVSFQRDLEALKRSRESASKQIQNHYSRVRLLTADKLRSYIASQNAADITHAQLLRSRDVCNALIKYFTKEKVFARLVEGSTVYGITAHFINVENEHEVALFKQCLINSNSKSMDYWNTVLDSKENWINEFGVDYAFRVPANDKRLFCERKTVTDESDENTD